MTKCCGGRAAGIHIARLVRGGYYLETKISNNLGEKMEENWNINMPGNREMVGKMVGKRGGGWGRTPDQGK